VDWTIGYISRLLKENCKDKPEMGKLLGDLFFIESGNPGWWKEKYKAEIKKYIDLTGDSYED